MTTHYVYGAGGLLYGEYDNSGNFIREYVYLNGAPLAQVNAGSPETVTYLHPDHLGTPKFGTNAGGTQVWAWAPDAFGNGSPSGAATVNLRMPGQFYDAESSLFYNWNRYYNPATGRYISSDPIGLEGGINTFLYAAASPVMAIDPFGLQSNATCVAFARACGSVIGGTLGFAGGVAAAGASSFATAGAALAASPAVVAMSTSTGIVAGVGTGDALGNLMCSDSSSSNNNGNDECLVLIAQIERHVAGMKKKWEDLALDRDGLFEGNLGFGTWSGHIIRYEGLRVGLRIMVAMAVSKGCIVPAEAYEWLNKQAPLLPFK